MKTTKLALMAMGMMAGLLNAGSAMAQGYYYEDGGYGGGAVVSSGCGNPNCRNPNCGGGGYSGGGRMSGGGVVMPIGGTYREDGRVSEGGISRRVPGHGGGRPMSGAEWRFQEDRRVQEQLGVRFQDPGMAVVGGVLGGIGNALNKDKAKNGAAGDILNGIGTGFMLGAQPELRYNRREEYRQQGNIIIW